MKNLKSTKYRIVFKYSATQIAFSPEQAIKRAKAKGNIPRWAEIVTVNEVKGE